MASKNNQASLNTLVDSLLEQHNNHMIHLPFLEDIPQTSHRTELENQIQIIAAHSNLPYRYEGAWYDRLRVLHVECAPIDETSVLSQQVAHLQIC